MALTLGQGAQLIADVGYQARVRDGMVRYALTVMAEALNAGGQTASTTGAKRKQLANRILLNPDAWLRSFLAAVAADAGASLTWYAPIAITSSTAVNPTVITTASVHGIVVGDVVEVVGHLGNTAANGTWVIPTVPTTTTLTVPFPASGSGTASGYVMKMETDITVNFTIQSQFNAVAATGSWDV